MPFSKRLREACPYPESVFLERTEEEWKQFHNVLREAGLCADGYLGSLSRYVWLLACDKVEEMEREQR